MRDKTMSKQEQAGYKFFRERGCTARGALEYARAEHEAAIRGWEVFWGWDDLSLDDCYPDHDKVCSQYLRLKHEQRTWHGREPSCNHECYFAQLRSEDGEVLDSLGGIVDPSNDYRREIEAELMVTALWQEEQAQADDLRKAYGLER